MPLLMPLHARDALFAATQQLFFSRFLLRYDCRAFLPR